MSSLCGQLIGWTPSGDGVQYDSGSAPRPGQAFLNSPFSKTSSSHPNSRPVRSSCQSTRRQHEPGWVARPRNAFIIFRCDYSQIHRRRGRRIRRPPGVPSTDPSLSKRAAAAWKQMTAEEKEPYRIRAEQERDEHVRNNPDYRFRPQRHPVNGPKSLYRLQSPLTSVTDGKMDPSTGYPPPCELSVASSVSSPTDSSLSLTAGGSQSDVCYESQYSSSSSTRWIHPIACNVSPSNSGSVQLPVEMMPIGHTASHFNNAPSSTMTESTCPVSNPPHLFQNGEISIPTTATGTPSSSNTSVGPSEVTNFCAPSPFAHCEGYYEVPYEAQQQNSYAEGLWYVPTSPYVEQMAPRSYQANLHYYAIPNDYSTLFPVL